MLLQNNCKLQTYLTSIENNLTVISRAILLIFRVPENIGSPPAGNCPLLKTLNPGFRRRINFL